MSASTSANKCPQCGEAIPAEAPQGLCPKCLLREVSIPTESGKGPTQKPAAPPAAELKAAFPHLEILELIGQGGMGFVYKARQPKLDRFVALKILPQSLASDPSFTERFTREGRVLAKLSHPNIVTVHDFGQANGFFYLLMEFVNGVNLRQAMKAGRFTPAQTLALVPDICEALQYAHTQGVLHRDIKPENILLDTNGRVKIADFGIAKLVGDDKAPGALTSSGAAIGTPQYMAPEQIERPAEVDHRADIYSLGVVLYELLTGELPLGRFPPPSAKTPVNENVDAVVLRALEKERERRYQSAGEVKTEVEGLRGAEKQVPAVPPPSWLVRAGILFLILGLIAWGASLSTAGTNHLNWRSESILIITGIALLTRRSAWRAAALVCNGLILTVTVVAIGLVVIGLTLGPFDWGPYVSGGAPDNPWPMIWERTLPWLGVLAGFLVLLRRDVRAAFRPSRSIWHGMLAVATPILLLAVPLLMWRFHFVSATKPPPLEAKSTNVTVPSIPRKTKTISLTGFNRLPWAHSNYQRANLFQISVSANLLPQEKFRTWLRLPDGTTSESSTHQITYYRSGEKHSSYLFDWVLPDSMEPERLNAAGSSLRQWDGKQLSLTVGQPLVLFRATNSSGGEYRASLEYVVETPPTNAADLVASVRVSEAGLSTNYGGTIVNLTVKLDSVLPAGHALECTAVSLAGLPEHSRFSFARKAMWRNMGCDWQFPGTFGAEQHEDAVRQMRDAAYILLPGGRTNVFSITNRAGDVLRGHLALIPPQ